jgi:hypothetical protein
MNEITVNKREWNISEVKRQANDDDDEGDRFDRGRSVFKVFKEDTEELLKKMFELDFSYTKISRVIKNNDDEF